MGSGIAPLHSFVLGACAANKSNEIHSPKWLPNAHEILSFHLLYNKHQYVFTLQQLEEWAYLKGFQIPPNS
jgi:hypothetical protein